MLRIVLLVKLFELIASILSVNINLISSFIFGN